jgi:sulfur dioxygenase
LIFRQLFDVETCSFTYLLAHRPGAEALIIDPVLEDVPRYARLVDELGVRLVRAIDTHFHADHVTGTGALRQAAGVAVAMGRETAAETVSEHFRDGAAIVCDGLCLQAMHTPGHTADSYCLRLGDKLFTGDTLLIGSAGRTDLPTGDARAQFHSLQRLKAQAPEMQIYPGHDYNGRTRSTIADEMRANPRLQITDEAAFAAAMAQLRLPLPKRFQAAMSANKRLGV